jgi:putative Holliday junction resolvase
MAGTRILAIDFGLKRMGLAVSDILGITAQGLPTLERTRMDDDLARIRELTEEYGVGLIVMGNPIGHAGGATAMSERAAEFAAKLAKRFGHQVELVDERLTTAQANRMLRESGIGLGKRRQAVDRVAATLLLQGYLDARARQRAELSADADEDATAAQLDSPPRKSPDRGAR